MVDFGGFGVFVGFESFEAKYACFEGYFACFEGCFGQIFGYFVGFEGFARLSHFGGSESDFVTPNSALLANDPEADSSKSVANW